MHTSVVIVCGPTASGKTTVARALADRLGWTFCDADDLHAPEDVERMRTGRPLTDALRRPWLARVRAAIEDARAHGHHIVVACSALKAAYREMLSGGLPDVRYVFLKAPEAVLRRRLAERQGHFAGVALLDSQLSALETPADALTVDATRPVESLVDAICADLRAS